MNKTTGFTLIEVLVAMLVIAIALTATIRALNSSVHAADHVRNQLAAHWVAMNVISEMQTGIISTPTDQAPLNGQSEMMNHVWDWSAQIDLNQSEVYAKNVVVTVFLNHQSVTTLSGYIRNAV